MSEADEEFRQRMGRKRQYEGMSNEELDHVCGEGE